MEKDTTVLLVEDDKFLIDILVKKFKSNGFTVLHAGDGKEALKLANDNQPDVIFLDVILPGMNGFEILKRIKEGSGQVAPVAFLSNLGQKEDIEKGKRMGAVDFIVKANHSLDEIVRKATQIINEHGSGDSVDSTSLQAADANKNVTTQQAPPAPNL